MQSFQVFIFIKTHDDYVMNNHLHPEAPQCSLAEPSPSSSNNSAAREKKTQQKTKPCQYCQLSGTVHDHVIAAKLLATRQRMCQSERESNVRLCARVRLQGMKISIAWI